MLYGNSYNTKHEVESLSSEFFYKQVSRPTGICFYALSILISLFPIDQDYDRNNKHTAFRHKHGQPDAVAAKDQGQYENGDHLEDKDPKPG